MIHRLLNKYGVNQLGYIVKDVEAASRAHAALFGSGPFQVMDTPPAKSVLYRGKPIELATRVAYGQLGDLQIELIQVLSEDPNAYLESGRYGFHHVSIWVDDFDAAMADFAAAGCEPAMLMESGAGMRIAFVDCRDLLGHYVECHAPIQGFWDSIKQKNLDWDGSEPYRPFGK